MNDFFYIDCINVRTTFELSNEIKIKIKSDIEKLIFNLFNLKNINFDFEENYKLFFDGKEVKKGIFLELETVNRKNFAHQESYYELRKKIKKIVIKELKMQENVFVQFYDN